MEGPALKTSSLSNFAPLAKLQVSDKLTVFASFQMMFTLTLAGCCCFRSYSLADPAALGSRDSQFKQVATINYSK